ncbi:hypothetical protein [Desertivirga brevis]|uniref:hypothetical protein n=1 Tax=Desertivirga brevis TaxID=2810310 RepID=UPI001A96A18E|nr:hypothetical protein [Pedobacter sp. SYSU D00873]
MDTDKSFFTVAYGKKFLALAFALARSYKLHNGVDIPFFIVSKEDFKLPYDLAWVQKKIIEKKIFGEGLEYKLKLATISPTEKSIFIDADSLIYDSIDSFFNNFSNISINVSGIKITKGIWVDLDADETIRNYQLPYLIRYCGALYFINKSEKSFEIQDNLQLILANSGFQNHKHGFNEEPIMSIALSKMGVTPIEDDGSLWGDLVHFESEKVFNIFKGRPTLLNAKYKPNFKFWIKEGNYSPAIIHMGSGIYNKNPWVFDSIRLKLHYKCFLSRTLSDLIVAFIIIPLYFLIKRLKNS